MAKKRNVACSMCQFEENHLCAKKKNIGIKLNKKRSCDTYMEDEEKVRQMVLKRLSSPKPEVTFRPSWFWDKNERKRLQKEAMKEELSKRIQEQQSVFTGDSSHPLTGDLSRFVKSTVGE